MPVAPALRRDLNPFPAPGPAPAMDASRVADRPFPSRTARSLPAALLMAAVLLTACGGGSDSTTAATGLSAPQTTAPAPPASAPGAAPAPAPAGAANTAYTVSGTMSVTETSAVDSDTNDPSQARVDNGSFESAQRLSNPVQLIGYLTMPGEGPAGPASVEGDLVDGYRMFLEEGQVVELQFAADPAQFDIDLFVYDVDGAIVGRSDGLNKYECLRIAARGQYVLGVQLFAGTSSGGSLYQMRIGAPGSGTACDNATGTGDLLIPYQIVAEVSESTRLRLSGARKSLDDLVLVKGDPGEPRPVLVRMPVGLDAQGAAAQRLQAAALNRRRAAAGSAGPQGKQPAGKSGAGQLDLQAQDQARQRIVATQLDAWRRRMPPRALAIHQTLDHAKLMVASGGFAHAVPDFNVRTAQTLGLQPYPPNDREYPKQRWHFEAINLPGAVAALQGVDLSTSALPVVAVIDTGIVADHPDLAGQLVAGYDFVSEAERAGDGGGGDADPDDASLEQGFTFHGSHVAGIIASQTYNDIGVAGVAPIARIMPVRALGVDGSGTLYDIIQSVRYAAGLPTDAGVVAARRAEVINLSLGADGVICAPMVQDLFSTVRARGSVVVAAAGNASRAGMHMPVSFPANCPNVFSVAATDAQNVRATYSNVGMENFAAAPGGMASRSTTGSGLPDAIYSTTASLDGAGARVPSYGLLQGTSMAVPHFAGVIALMRWIDPTLTAAGIEELVRSGAIVDDIGSPGRDPETGYGMINARKAVEAALAGRVGGMPQPAPAGGQVQAQPSAISLGSVRTEADLVLVHVGEGNDRVLSVTSDSPVVTVEPKNAGAVDPVTGLGTYRILANRQLMGTGTSAFPTVEIRLTPTRVITVQVALERRASGGSLGELGPIYLVVLDAQDPARGVVASANVTVPAGGLYRYSVTVPGTAAISITAGSDIDNDGGICSPGEACGAYPMLPGQLEVLTPGGSLTGIDFSLAPHGGVNAGSAEVRR